MTNECGDCQASSLVVTLYGVEDFANKEEQRQLGLYRWETTQQTEIIVVVPANKRNQLDQTPSEACMQQSIKRSVDFSKVESAFTANL